MKVALVYDRINKWGGAERVLLALHEIFPQAPLYTAVYDQERAGWWAEVFNIETSFLQKFPWAKSYHEFYPWLTSLAFESFNFDEYDLVISVTSADAKGIITKPDTLHICYCLTPTRYLWSHYEDYFRNKWFRCLTSGLVTKLRIWDQVAASRPDYMVAISRAVALRVKKYYRRESEVIYPPASRMILQEDHPPRGSSSERSQYFLVISRLVPYKRVDLAIKAFNKLGLPLVVVGRGVEERRLRVLAYKNITFLKDLTNEELSWYYRHCRALIMPQEEDFGLAAVEAQAFGKPVIAYKAGGVLETVIEGKTGYFFYPQTAEALMKVLKQFENKNYYNNCKKNAEKFSKERFKKEFREFIDNCYKDYKNYNHYK